MNFSTQARAYFWEEGDKIVVQNAVGAYLGQKHEHTVADFATWRASAEKDGWIVEDLVTKESKR